nr:unnamed protein product [Leishmania braziliensis]
MRRRLAVFVFSEHRPAKTASTLSHIPVFYVPLRWQSNYESDPRNPGSGTGFHSGNAPLPQPAEATTSKAETVVKEATIPDRMILDWSGGSAYYFSEEENMRLFPSNSCPVSDGGSRGPAGPLSPPHVGSSNSDGGTKGDIAEPTSRAVIHGVARNFSIDLTIPPVRREEVERWKLDGYLFCKGFNASGISAYSTKRYNQLLPSSAMVTYLGPEMRKLDQIHRQKGFFTPSEVAEVFIPLVPTFPVESRHVMAAVPPAIMKRIEKAARSTSTLAQMVFEHYPMLFHYSPNRYRPALVQLNSEFWFVRQHPGYGKADRALLQFRSHGAIDFDARNTADGKSGVEPLYAAEEKAAAEAAPSLRRGPRGASMRRPWSVEMLAVLVRNLPRVPTPEGISDGMASKKVSLPREGKPLVRERYRPLNLVQWVNSFPPDDLAFVNKTREVAVVQLITQYVHVFQLMSLKKGDHNLFVEGHVLLSGGTGSEWKADAVASPASSASAVPSTESGDEASPAREAVEEEEGITGWWSVDVASIPEETGTAKCRAGPLKTGNTTSTADDRERAFKQAVAEELIDLDDLAEERGGGPTPLDSEGDFPATVEDAHQLRGAALGGEGDEGVFQDGGNEVDTYRDDGIPTLQRVRDLQAQREPPKGPCMDEVTTFGLPLEELYVRRLPPDVAPRSLSDLDETTSPDPELLVIAASFLASPPSLQSSTTDCFFRRCRQQRWREVRPIDEVWRWLAVERLYSAFTVEQRRHLRDRYRGLVGFLRYHGKVFELSGDLMYVIAHDPRGTMAPIPPMERVFRYANRVVLPDDFDDNPDRCASLVGEAERKMFVRVLGEGAIPSHRRHLLLLDPDNPLMLHEVLYDEIANLLPDHPVPFIDLMTRLPPVMRAALPHTLNFSASKCIDVYVERGKTMIRKKLAARLGAAPSPSKPRMSVEEAIAELLQLPVGKDGISLRALVGMYLSVPATSTLEDHFGSVGRAVRMLPQYFEVWEHDAPGRKRMVMVRLRQ